MKIKLIMILFFIVFNVFAQDSVTIVAVGDAEQENEKIAFTKPKFESGISFGEQKVIGKLIKLFISDFSFYKHIFEVIKKPISQGISVPNYLNWKTSGYRYVVNSIFRKKNKKIILDITLYDVQLAKELIQDQSIINIHKIRKDGHLLSDKLYTTITGKKSIFNSKIVFVSDKTSKRKDFRKEIYIMDFDGERKQRLTYSNSLIISPSISPDNTKILYSIIESKWRKSSRGKIHKVKNINLYIYNLLTRKKTKLSDVDGINSGAVFSADGKNIYLTLSYLRNADIFKINLATRRKTKVTKHYSDDVDPHINAAGDMMTFLSARSGRAMIYTLDPRGVEKNVKRISYVGKFNAAPRFSPDGKEIVFSSWVDNRFDIYKIDSNGNNLVRLTKNFGSNEEAWFSPDGQFIVFSSQRVLSRKKAVQNLYIMNREGEIIRKVTHKFGKNYTPRWSN